MAVIMVPVEAMDENCKGCQCMQLEKEPIVGLLRNGEALYICKNIHMCQYIRNRIVRKEEKAVKEISENGHENNPKE